MVLLAMCTVVWVPAMTATPLTWSVRRVTWSAAQSESLVVHQFGSAFVAGRRGCIGVGGDEWDPLRQVVIHGDVGCTYVGESRRGQWWGACSRIQLQCLRRGKRVGRYQRMCGLRPPWRHCDTLWAATDPPPPPDVQSAAWPPSAPSADSHAAASSAVTSHVVVPAPVRPQRSGIIFLQPEICCLVPRVLNCCWA